MKSKVFLIVSLILTLVACGKGVETTNSIPTVILGNNPTLPGPDTSAAGGVTASGVVVADQEARMAFELAGNIKSVNVAVGDRVQTGQILFKLNDITQQIQLDRANLAIYELTSAAALAVAQQAVAMDQQELYDSQAALNNLTGQYNNQGLISNTHAGLVLAQEALNEAQSVYDATPGNKDIDPPKARAYQKLYSTQQNYDHAVYIYNLYSGNPNPATIEKATARVALAKAILMEDQTLVTALTGGILPENPTGSGYARLMQAKFDITIAQANLDATRLLAPFPGEIVFVNASIGDYISPGQVILVISDVNHLHVETTDLSELDVPQVKINQAATAFIKALNQVVSGKVTAISPLADILGGDVVYKVTISLDQVPLNLRAGMSTDVKIDTSP
jgi:multidrug efflux pump subunit AcrA (membrane-fusion protein)